MTSGHFRTLPIDEILIRRDARQRRELTDIPVLADSIRRLGLIHPIVITREYELVSGERRLTACKSLEWISIPAQFVDEVEPHILEAIELEENIKRKDVDWKDQVQAIQRYHKGRATVDPTWNQTNTAEALGLSPQWISHIMVIANEIELGNELVINAPLLSTARGNALRATARREETILTGLRGGFQSIALEPTEPESILTKDFTEWVLGDHKIRFNFIHCDFPYGIGADEFNQGGAKALGGYADTQETWERLMMALEIATKTLTAPSCHLMFWFSMRKGWERLYEPTARALERIGWDLNPMPLIWMKSDGAGILPDPERGPRQIYETCFLGSKGDRKIVRSVANAYSAPTVRERHMSEKPEPMLRHFFGMLVDANTIMLDPTCGSGSALRAADSMGARYVLGLELNPEWAETARQALKKAQRLRKASEVINARD